jgi:ParB family transcriptional regulator, chromosome partitioning protein
MNKRKLLLANNPLLSGPNLEERARPIFGAPKAAPQDPVSPYKEILIADIIKDPSQPRKEFDKEKLNELALSISEYGVMSPLLVREDEDGKYILIAGERRLRASTLAGLAIVPVVVEGVDRNEADILAMQLVENLQREGLTSVERAQAIIALRDAFGVSVREIAKKLGVSKSMVQRSVDILSLPADLIAALEKGASESKVLILSRVDDPEIRASLLEDLDFLSRGDLEREIGKKAKRNVQVKDQNRTRLKPEESSEDIRVAEEIQRALGLKVVVQRFKGDESGRLLIDFYNHEDLQEVFKRLVGEE